MAYSDQVKRSSPGSIIAVIGIHAAIGYAIVSGLAVSVMQHIPIITAVSYPDDPPPPPPKETVVVKTTRPTADRTVVPPTKTDDLFKREEVIVPTFPDDILASGNGGGTIDTTPPPQPKPSLARGLVAGAERLRWITSADYPSAALRNGIEGVVTIATQIGADGKVKACEVTVSSGDRLLDETTCRLYTKRAHFSPALDADGNPIAAQRTDRFRWQIPN